MSTLVIQQFFEFLVLLYGGMVAAFIYDLLKLYQKTFKSKSVLRIFQELLYWIMTTSLVIYLLYYSSSGQVKGHMAIALIMGFSIYKWLLSKMIQTTITTIVIKMIEINKILKKQIYYPIRNIIKNENNK